MDEQAGPGQQADPALEALQAILQGGPHPTASSYRVYNAYIKVSPVGQPRVFADPSVSLAIFKQHHSMAIDANRSTSVGAGRNTLLLPGETTMNTYRIATEMGKKVCTSLVELMNEAADAGYCFDNIDVTNVFIEYDGNVKLSGVQELWGLNDLDFNNHLGVNFLSIGNIIDHGIFDGNPPPDIAHLTNLMRSDQCYEERKFYSTHAGLIPLLTYPSLIKEFHDFCKFVVPKSIFRRVLRRLPHVQGWRSSVRSNTHLKSTLDYQHGYRLPLNTHGQRKLKRDQKDALTDLGYGRTELRQRNLTCDQLDLIDSLKLFTYMRNRPARRMEAKYRKQVYAARCSELLTRVRFPLWLCEMQHRLHKTGWLKKLKLKPLFFSRGVSRRMELWK